MIGTAATMTSGAYQDAFAAAPHIEVTAPPARGSSTSSSAAYTSGRQVLGLAKAYLAPLAAADVDTLVLGCTHYPLLTGVIQLSMGDEVTLVSSAEETAKDVYRVLTAGDLLRDDDAPAPRHRFLATGDPEPFAPAGPPVPGPGGRARWTRLLVPA